MITINLKGGLGNQMFQYATGRFLSLKYKKDLILNTEYFSNIPQGDVPRKYQLDIFNVTKDIKLEDKINPLKKLLQKISTRLCEDKTRYVLSNLLLKLNFSAHLNGYFQSCTYFNNIRDLLLKEFTLVEKLGTEALKIEDSIKNTESVCINIRRTDYLRPDYIKVFGGCSMEYYQQAIKLIEDRVENPTFFIFSDDPTWVKEQFKMENVIFAGNDVLKDYEQLNLMKTCKHNILANSSFSWWGAWLNENPQKIVIGPKWWTANKTSNQLKILPKEWIQIENH